MIIIIVKIMCEKRVETYLDSLLIDFNKNHIYYAPSEHEILEKIFSKASKSGNGRGIPDRIYFDKNILIIFECKQSSLNLAKKDLKTYFDKIKNHTTDLQIYFVSVVEDNYEIYSKDFKKISKKLNPKNFNINIITSYDIQNMEKDIHKIHNYIRDYTKISNEDKGFFIACILISLKKTSFLKIFENYDTKKFLYDIMKQNLLDFEIDISVFEFLRNDDNNEHFFNIINMVKKIYEKNPSTDLLNKFYSEFVRYNNSDGKTLGIVLTPDHIVKLMINMLEINENDTFLDLCSGTGSFALEVLNYKPKDIIVCEYQNKLYSLLKCNMLLRDVDLTKNNIIKGDCFEYDFKATKSAINPPYGMKDKKELDFIIKQLESIENGGLICAIIPKSKLNSNKVNDKFKKKIMNIGSPKTIINCNPKLFYPMASVECCIILIKKEKVSSHKINILDYTNDGIEISINNGCVKNKQFDTQYQNIIDKLKTNQNQYDLKVESDWCYLNKCDNTCIEFDLSLLELKKLEQEYINKRNEILLNPKIKLIDNIKNFTIGDLFYVLKSPREEYTNIDAEVNIAAAINNNNGIKSRGKATKKTFTGNKILLITGGNGGAGLAFYQKNDFMITSSTAVLEPKKELNLDEIIGKFISIILSKYKSKYSYSYQWNLTRISNDIISLPILNDGKIAYNIIYDLF